MNKPSLFTKIISGEIPSHKVYEDSHTLAFLDIHPTVEGHVLVVPKLEVEFVWDLPDEDYHALMSTVKKVAHRLKDILGKKYVGEMIVGTDVPHAHVHVQAFNETHELKRTLEGSQAEPDHVALATMAEKLRFS
jgi:histidine triad (HIT) family protein